MVSTRSAGTTMAAAPVAMAAAPVAVVVTVLAEHDLSWTAFVVLWVVWIWEPVESRVIAEEGGFSKATLTGVMQTLEGRGLITRTRSSKDGRLVLVKLTAKGRKMITGWVRIRYLKTVRTRTINPTWCEVS